MDKYFLANFKKPIDNQIKVWYLSIRKRKEKENKTMTVKFTYFYGEFKEGVSKVYDIQKKLYPSGWREVYKVWVADRNAYEWMKKEACKVI